MHLIGSRFSNSLIYSDPKKVIEEIGLDSKVFTYHIDTIFGPYTKLSQRFDGAIDCRVVPTLIFNPIGTEVQDYPNVLCSRIRLAWKQGIYDCAQGKELSGKPENYDIAVYDLANSTNN